MNELISYVVNILENYLIFGFFIIIIFLFSLFVNKYIYKLGNYLSKTDEPIKIKILKSFRIFVILGLPFMIIIYYILIQEFPEKENEILLKNAIVITSIILVSIRILANPSYYLNKTLEHDDANLDKRMFLGVLYGFFFSTFILISISAFNQIINIGDYNLIFSKFFIPSLPSILFYGIFLLLGASTGEIILYYLEPIVAPGLLRITDENETAKDKNNVLKSIDTQIEESVDYGKKLITKIIYFVKNKLFLIACLVVIAYGFSVVSEAQYQRSIPNSIIISPQSAIDGVVIDDDEINQFNFSAKELPNIEILIDYKEPVFSGDDLNIKKICPFIENPHERFQKYEFILYLYGSEGSIFDAPELIYQNFSTKFTERKNSRDISKVKSIDYYNCSQFKDKNLVFIEPNQENEYELSYKLKIFGHFNESEIIELKGKANLSRPIRGTSPVEELNIKTNENILKLTGYLIILGSCPFFLALKKILNNE